MSAYKLDMSMSKRQLAFPIVAESFRFGTLRPKTESRELEGQHKAPEGSVTMVVAAGSVTTGADMFLGRRSRPN